jgi:hypothetical protein
MLDTHVTLCMLCRDTFYTPGPEGYTDYPFLEPRDEHEQ